MARKQAFKDIDEYIAGFPNDVQEVLEKIRASVKKAVPASEEKISYDMPHFMLNGEGLIAFAGWKKHVSLYAAPRRNPELMKEVAPYLSGAATVKMPMDKPIPFDLIIKIVKFREKEILEKYRAK
jgi:uncharacterized protein YdhG (YjbR/CyaY superfamily)